MPIDKFLRKELTEENKPIIIQNILEEVERAGSARVGFHAEKILNRNQFSVPRNILSKIEATLIQDKRYLSRPYQKSAGDFEIYKNPDYKPTTEREKEIEDMTYTKLKYDAKNSKRIYDTYWVTFALAVAAFFISLLLLVLKLAELAGSKP